MDPNNGGLTSPSDKQRQAAAAIARRKVLDAYKIDNTNDYASTPTKEEVAQKPQISNETWHKYHSAWQEYYQKYYSTHYTKAAQQHLEQEKLKLQRQEAEKQLKEVDFPLTKSIAVQNPQEILKDDIRQKASARSKRIRRSRHFIPILAGIIIVFAALVFQYNQYIFANVAAYISPGNATANEITAIDPTITMQVGPEPLLIIPKLNIQVPINFDTTSDQSSMSNAMLNGIAHFSVPGANALPGQIGNFVVSGHSAGNVYWNSDYKFIFSGLERLDSGDLVYVNYNSTRYTYSINSKQTVDPSDVAALIKITTHNPGKPVLTMITCTPLGTSKYRLLVSAEQISPNPEGAASSEPDKPGESIKQLEMPANEAAPLEAFWRWLTGQE